MAISPVQTGGFLEGVKQRRVQQNLVNFGIRTGQKFSDLARSNLLTEVLVQERADREARDRARVAAKEQQSLAKARNRRLDLVLRDQEEAKDQRRSERKRRTAAGAVVGFQRGGILGAIVGAVIGGK